MSDFEQDKKPKPCKGIGDHKPWKPLPFPNEYGREFQDSLEAWAENLKQYLCTVDQKLWPGDPPAGRYPPPDPPFG